MSLQLHLHEILDSTEVLRPSDLQAGLGQHSLQSLVRQDDEDNDQSV
jgi:hypothetical protein